MARLPQVSGKKLIKILEKTGYEVVKQKSSHIRMCHLTKKSVTIPNHKTIGKGLLVKILKDTELSLEDFKSILNK
jgi:predicted RNA binding protein YcfA (HicA-like mRNA interferase family)